MCVIHDYLVWSYSSKNGIASFKNISKHSPSVATSSSSLGFKGLYNLIDTYSITSKKLCRSND